MNETPLLAFIVATLAVAAVARRKGWPVPLVIVAVGLAVSFIPGVPHFEVEPELLLGVALPPLLYSASTSSSYQDLRSSLHSITRLGVGLVLVSAFAVAGAVVLFFPDIPFAAALVLGAVVAPPDAVSAAAVGKRLGLPRRVMTVLTGESLINDATSLTLYKVALAGVAGGAWTLSAGLKVFAVAVIVGVGVGLVIGFVAHRVRLALADPPIATLLGLVVPFASYWLAEELSGSGVLAVVAAGLYLGHHSIEAGYATRLEEEPLWGTIDLALETLTFALIGVQLKWLIGDVLESDQGLAHALLVSAAVFAVVVLIRPVYVFATSWMDRIRLPGSPRPENDTLTGSEATVVSWAGMRGVVTLAAAAAIPKVLGGESFPEHASIQLAAYAVAIGTLLVQGTTLPWLIRRLRVGGEEDLRVDSAQEMRVRMLMAKAQADVVTNAVDQWSRTIGEDKAKSIAAGLKDRIMSTGAAAAQVFREDESLRELVPPTPTAEVILGGQGRPGLPGGTLGVPVRGGAAITKDAKKARARMVTQVRRDLINAQREVLTTERDAGHLNEDVTRRLLREIDLAEESLATSWMVRTSS